MLVRNEKYRFLVFITTFLHLLPFSNCYNLKIASPGGGKFIVLGNKSLGTCTVIKEFKQWKFLYGTVPLNNVNIPDFFWVSDSQKMYIIEQTFTVTDVVISLVTGFLTAITRNTIYVFQCTDNLAVGLTGEEKELIINAIRDDSAKCIEKGYYMNGKTYKIYVPEN